MANRRSSFIATMKAKIDAQSQRLEQARAQAASMVAVEESHLQALRDALEMAEAYQAEAAVDPVAANQHSLSTRDSQSSSSGENLIPQPETKEQP